MLCRVLTIIPFSSKDPLKAVSRKDYSFTADAPVHCPGFTVLIPHRTLPAQFCDLTADSSSEQISASVSSLASTSRDTGKRKREQVDLTQDSDDDELEYWAPSDKRRKTSESRCEPQEVIVLDSDSDS